MAANKKQGLMISVHEPACIICAVNRPSRRVRTTVVDEDKMRVTVTYPICRGCCAKFVPPVSEEFINQVGDRLERIVKAFRKEGRI